MIINWYIHVYQYWYQYGNIGSFETFFDLPTYIGIDEIGNSDVSVKAY